MNVSEDFNYTQTKKVALIQQIVGKNNVYGFNNKVLIPLNKISFLLNYSPIMKVQLIVFLVILALFFYYLVKYYRSKKEIRTLELKVKQLHVNLEKSNKRLLDYTQKVSFNCREPTRVLIYYSNYIKKFYNNNLPEKLIEAVYFVEKNSIRIHELCENLVNFTSNQNVKIYFSLINMNDVLFLIKNKLDKEIKNNNVQIIGDLDFKIHSSFNLIFILLRNIINNAIKFKMVERPVVIDIFYVKTEDGYFINIKDNGIGIKAKDLNRIFEPFIRLNPYQKYPGSGFGLSQVKGFIELLNGKINVVSQFGTGTIFTVFIPNGKPKRMVMNNFPRKLTNFLKVTSN